MAEYIQSIPNSTRVRVFRDNPAGGLTNVQFYDATGGTEYIGLKAVTSAGSVVFNQPSAAVWKDAMFPGQALMVVVGSSDPTRTTVQGSVQAWGFSPTAMNQGWGNFEIDHDYTPSTTVYPHIHWAPVSTNTGVVRWGLEYTYAKSGDPFPATTTIYLSQAGGGTAYKNQIVEDATGITTIETGGILCFRVFRDAADPADTYDDVALLMQIGLHYQTNRNGTTSRTAPWDP